METQSQEATVAAGCFWGVEHAFRQIPGVVDTVVGYTGGHKEQPTYEQVCAGETGHAEAVRITYDPSRVSYEQLLDTFFDVHDPTQLNRQGVNIGNQYRSVLFVHSDEQRRQAEQKIKTVQQQTEKPIVTRIEPAGVFYRAEEYHQRYVEKTGTQTC